MHILFIHQAFVSPKEGGGTRHYEMASRLVKRGCDFSIVASDMSYMEGVRHKDAKGWFSEQDVDGIRVLRAYTYPALHRSFVWRVISFLSFMVTSVWAGWRAGKVDVVMGTTPPLFQALSAWVLSVIRWCPFLLEVRDLWPEFAIDIGVLKNPVLIWLARRLENFLYARASHILVNSPAYRDYLLEKGIPAEKISFIPNGVDPEMFCNGGDRDIRSEFNLHDKFVVTYAGALGLANDIDNILEAARITADDNQIHYLLVGDGKERSRLQQKATDLKLTNVTFAGVMPKQDMSSVLEASDLCLATLRNIPMFKTTYPNKVFDYMAAAKPVVLAIDGVIREVVEAAHGGVFVQPGSSEELADAIRKLNSNRQEASSMGKAGQDYVALHFNRNTHAEELRELVNRLGKTTSRAA